MMPQATDRGQYVSAAPASRIDLGLIGVGVLIGFASLRGVRAEKPLGLIGMGVAGNMVAVGLAELLFGKHP
jgi:hypothetical protein